MTELEREEDLLIQAKEALRYADQHYHEQLNKVMKLRHAPKTW